MNVKKLSKEIKSLKYKKVEILTRTLLSLIVAFAFLLVFFFCGGIEYFSNSNIVKSSSASEMEVHFIDVGQGDATLIRFPNDKLMLIDTGESYESDSLLTYLTEFLNFNNLNSIEYLVLTHADADHVGGTSEVVNNFNVGIVYRPKCFSKSEIGLYPELDYEIVDTNIYDDAISSIFNKGIEMTFSESGIEFSEGGANIKFLSPSKDSYSSSNNYSAVIKIEYEGKSFLFTGDCESEAENEMIDNFYAELDIDVLKVSHHGSKSATGEEFLKATTPVIACISVGEDNQYDLPDSEVINLLKNYNCQIVTTSESGSFAVAITNGELDVFYIISPSVDFTIVISVCGVLLILIWGIKVNKKKN